MWGPRPVVFVGTEAGVVVRTEAGCVCGYGGEEPENGEQAANSDGGVIWGGSLGGLHSPSPVVIRGRGQVRRGVRRALHVDFG